VILSGLPVMALNSNSLSGAEIVSCWGYNCRRGNPTKRRPARNVGAPKSGLRRLVADPFVPVHPGADEPADSG